MVTVTVVPIAPGEEGTLAHLLQLYQYDFSEIEPSDVASDGRFHQLEFFVMRKYRRASIGTRAARLVIERHPGTWEITQTLHKACAVTFWRQALAPYAFEERSFDLLNGGRRSLQRFCR